MDITLDFEVECEKCGKTLNVTNENLDIRKATVTLTIQPCQRCLDTAKDAGYEDGIGQ